MPKIKIESVIAATPQRVWSAWTTPDHIMRWNFATSDWCCPSAQNDLRVGGKYSSRMEAKDKSFGFDFEYTYDEIIDQKRIAYTMSDGRKATTEFESLGDQTKVTTTFEPEQENPEEMQKQGWQAILDNFKKYVESL